VQHNNSAANPDFRSKGTSWNFMSISIQKGELGFTSLVRMTG
jgi:hypothetical protein